MFSFRNLFAPKPNPDDRRFGFAVFGTGHGAEKMCDAVRDSAKVRVTAIISSSQDRAAAFARRYNIPRALTYDRLDEFSGNAAIDAVYLALPVSLHRRFTEQAAALGKHVLCEKPMAATIADAEAMITACAAADRQLMLAYRLDYDPAHDKLRRMIDANILGKIEYVSSAFGILAKHGWRFDPALAGGGSLFDVGVYPIHALHALFGETTITSAEVLEDPTTHMELEANWRGTLANGATFECVSSYLRRVPDTLHIRGERGHITLTHAFDYSRTALEAKCSDTAGKQQTIRFCDSRRNPNLFRLEAEHLAEAVHSGTPVRTPGESGLRDLQTIAAIEAIAARKPRT
jgi:predicted dehydrogenase